MREASTVHIVLVAALVTLALVPGARAEADPDDMLVYHGGKVLTTPKAYITYWRWNTPIADPYGAKDYLNAFFQGVGGSAWAEVQTQYAGYNGQIQNPIDQWGGAWEDNSALSIPAGDLVMHDSLFVQKELINAVNHFGYDPNGVYFIALPHGTSDVDFAGGYCAYHSYMDLGGRIVQYSMLPYVADFPTTPSAARNVAFATCGVGVIAGSPHPELDAFSIVAGHEYEEAVTDPMLDAWWAPNGENADICAFDYSDGPGAHREITLSTGTFGVQSLWSNRDQGCVSE